MQYPRYRLKYERGEPRQPWAAGFGLCSLGQSLPWTASVAAALNASAEFAPTAELELHSDTYAPGNARAYDELILWRRILSDAEVMQHFAETQTCAFLFVVLASGAAPVGTVLHCTADRGRYTPCACARRTEVPAPCDAADAQPCACGAPMLTGMRWCVGSAWAPCKCESSPCVYLKQVSAFPAAVPSARPPVSALGTVRIIPLSSSDTPSNGVADVLLARCFDNKT